MKGNESRWRLAIPPAPPPWSQDKALLLFTIILIIVRLWLVTVFELLTSWTPHDDYLFISMAKSLLAGDWLGSYSEMTLIKGVGFPLFIALAHLLGIPLLVAGQLMYSLAAWVAFLSLRWFCRNRWLSAFLFAALLFNPFMYNYPMAGHVLREPFAISLITLCFSCLIGLSCRAARWLAGGRGLPQTMLWSAAFGLTATWLWYTREEGIWLLPPLTLGLLLFFLARGEEEDCRFLIRRLLRRLALLVPPLLIFCLATFLIAWKNHHYYGVWIINELKSKEFVSAYGGLMNIDSGTFPAYVPVRVRTLQAAFAVSPTLRELEPRFLAIRSHWPPSFFIWTLRAMAHESGKITSLPQALAFYRQVGDELAAACQDGRLSCLNRRPSLQPPWHSWYNRRIIPEFTGLFAWAVGFDHLQDLPKRFEHDRSTFLNKTVYDDFRFVTQEKLVPTVSPPYFNYPDYYQHLRVVKTDILNNIAGFYPVLMPYLFAVACCLHLFFLGRDIIRRRLSLMSLWGLALFGGLVSLLAVLTYVKITLWPVARTIYPAYALVLLYVVWMLAGGLQGHTFFSKIGEFFPSGFWRRRRFLLF